MKYFFYYGYNNAKIEVSEYFNNPDNYQGPYMFVPKGDEERAEILSDPFPGIEKTLFVFTNSGFFHIVDSIDYMYIHPKTNEIYINECPPDIKIE